MNLETCFLDGLNKHNIPYSINGENRVPGVCNITFFDMPGQDLVLQLDFSGIGISSGSACTSGTIERSHVLSAMKLAEDRIDGSFRISAGRSTTKDEIKELISNLNNY